jgi:hypothetical protein
MAHDVFFKIPEKQLFGGPIKIIVHRDTTGRKNIPENARKKGKFGELHVSEAGIVWYKSGASKGVPKSWRKLAKLLDKNS